MNASVVDVPVPDLFTDLAQKRSQLPLVQIIREYLDAPTDCIRFTWAEVLQHAKNAAADLRSRWSERHQNENKKKQVAQPREPGSPLIVAAVLASNGFELYVNILACTLNRWTVCFSFFDDGISLNVPIGSPHLVQEQSGCDRTSPSYNQLYPFPRRSQQPCVRPFHGASDSGSHCSSDRNPQSTRERAGSFAYRSTHSRSDQRRNGTTSLLHAHVWVHG